VRLGRIDGPWVRRRPILEELIRLGRRAGGDEQPGGDRGRSDRRSSSSRGAWVSSSAVTALDEVPGWARCSGPLVDSSCECQVIFHAIFIRFRGGAFPEDRVRSVPPRSS